MTNTIMADLSCNTSERDAEGGGGGGAGKKIRRAGPRGSRTDEIQVDGRVFG